MCVVSISVKGAVGGKTVAWDEPSQQRSSVYALSQIGLCCLNSVLMHLCNDTDS